MKNLPLVYSATFSIFCAAIPFTDLGEAIPNIIMLLNLIIFPFVLKKSDFQKLNKHVLFSFVTLITLVLIETLVFQRWDDFKFISRLILVPVIILLALPIKEYKFPMIGFLIGAFLLAMWSSINILIFVNQSGGFDFAVGKDINAILLGDRPYMGFVYVIATILGFYLSKSYKSNLKYLFWFTSVFFILIIIVISARLSLLTLFTLLFSSIFYLKEKKIILLVIGVLILIVPTLLYFNDNVKNRFFMGFKQEEISVTKAMEMEPRYHIWNCVKILSSDKSVVLSGSGFKQTEEKLINCYKEKPGFLNNDQRNWFVESRFNTHNQFFNFYLASGILTPFVFILFFWNWFWETKNIFLRFGLFFSVFLFCILENMLSRQMGAMLFAVIYIFSCFLSQDLEEASS